MGDVADAFLQIGPPLAPLHCLSYPRPTALERRAWGKALTHSTADNGDIIRFRLSGRSRPYDPLTQAIRPDLADVAEAATHFAPHYAEPAATVTLRETPLLASPLADAEVVAMLPAGAAFALLDLTGDWAWGYALEGHRVGYVADADLSAPTAPTA